MLNMFKRPDDPPENYHLCGIAAGIMATICGIGYLSGQFP
jgi:hypothetical protein